MQSIIIDRFTIRHWFYFARMKRTEEKRIAVIPSAGAFRTGEKSILYFRNTRNLIFFLRRDEGMIDSIVDNFQLSVTCKSLSHTCADILGPQPCRRAGLMSSAAGYCARNKRYRKGCHSPARTGVAAIYAAACRFTSPGVRPDYKVTTATLALFMSVILENGLVAVVGGSRFYGSSLRVLIPRSQIGSLRLFSGGTPNASINGNTRTCGDSELVLSTIVSTLHYLPLFLSLSLFVSLFISLDLFARSNLSIQIYIDPRVRLKITHPDTLQPNRFL